MMNSGSTCSGGAPSTLLAVGCTWNQMRDHSRQPEIPCTLSTSRRPSLQPRGRGPNTGSRPLLARHRLLATRGSCLKCALRPFRPFPLPRHHCSLLIASLAQLPPHFHGSDSSVLYAKRNVESDTHETCQSCSLRIPHLIYCCGMRTRRDEKASFAPVQSSCSLSSPCRVQ